MRHFNHRNMRAEAEGYMRDFGDTRHCIAIVRMADRIDQLIRVLRKCEVLLDGITPSWEIDSPFHWRLREAHSFVVDALDEGTSDGLPASYDDYVASLRDMTPRKK